MSPTSAEAPSETWRRHLEVHPNPPPRDCVTCGKLATVLNTRPVIRKRSGLSFETRCSSCNAQRRARQRRTKKYRITDMLSHMKYTHTQRRRRGRHDADAADAGLIGRSAFIKMVDAQPHCYHCKHKLQWEGPSTLYTASVDRLCCDGTYTADNIVMSCMACNDMRRDMTVDQYHTFLRQLAKEVLHGETPSDAEVGLANVHDHMVYSCRSRDSKARGVWKVAQYVALAKKQEYRCYYTGAKLRFPAKAATRNPHLPWPCSFDQLDPQGGYGANTVLCLRSVNYMRRNFPPAEARTRIMEIIRAFSSEDKT